MQKIQQSVIFGILSVIVIILTHFQIYLDDSLTAFRNVFLFIFNYSNNNPSTVEMIKNFLTEHSEFWGYHLSCIVSFGVLVTLYRFIAKDINYNRYFFQLIFVMLFFLLLSVVIEKKFSVYMFSRLFIPIVLLSASGLIIIYDKIIKYQYFKKIRFNVIIILTIIFLSPAIKYSKAVVISYS